MTAEDVMNFSEDFQKILIEIQNISIEEQTDRYTRGVKPYIRKKLCHKDYESLAEATKDAERVESAHRRGGIALGNGKKDSRSFGTSLHQGPVRMDLGNT